MNVFDLNGWEYQSRLLDLLERATARIATEHPTESVSAMVLYGEGYHGGFHVSFDTPENDEAIVQKWGDKGPPWIGHDDAGKFNNSPCDFAYHAFESWYPDRWLELIDSLPDEDGILTLRDSQGRESELDIVGDGDEAINEPLFDELVAILTKFGDQPESLAKLNLAPAFRFGVRMQDSEFMTFWKPANPQR